MTRVLITRPMPSAVIRAAQAEFEVEIRDSNTPLSASELRAALREFDGVMPTLGDQFSAAVFGDVPKPRARVLANFGVGFNHIDVSAAAAAGVTVTNTPGVVTDATADIALTLMLMSARRAGEGERLVRRGAWSGWHPTQMLGLHLTGKTVGIVGMGRIGQAIAKRCAQGFGMSVLFYNRSKKQIENAVQVDDLGALAQAVDILVVAVPGGNETHHLIDAAILGQMQRHAHLINISRGDVVDEAALITALITNQIAGAGLDVYEHEPEVPKALRELECVSLLPHLGTAAKEVRIAMGQMALENMRAVLAERPPPNPV